MKRRKTKKVKMVRILGETVRKGGVRYRFLLAERRNFLRRQRDPESSYYGVPISELLKSNRRRTKRCWKGYSPVKGMRPYSRGSCRRIKNNARRKPRASDLARWRAEAKVRDDKSRGIFWTSTKDYMSGPKYDPARWDSRGVPINTPDWYRASLKSNGRRGLRRNPETTKARPIPGMFYSIWFSGRGGQTAKLVVKGEILKKASISNLSRMFPYFEMNKLQKLHTAGPYSSFDEAFLNR